VQTFNEASRQAVKRLGEGSLLPQKLKAVSDIYGHDFSVDLMSGLPFQDEEVLLSDIEKLLAFEPGHISLYALTVDAETPLGAKRAKSEVLLPKQDEADDLWLAGREALENAGYAQYEVSNFCIPGKESRHNLRYWRMENWLGIGPSASGTLIDDNTGTGLRFTNAADVNVWLKRKPGKAPNVESFFSSTETLDAVTLIKETLLMGFRLLVGPDNNLFQHRFGKSIEEIIPNTIKAWRNRGLFCEDKTALNKQGLLLLNTFLVDVFKEVDTSGPAHYEDY
jgi:oxygen-independent coproporphyrinogen-3 oxidase